MKTKELIGHTLAEFVNVLTTLRPARIHRIKGEIMAIIGLTPPRRRLRSLIAIATPLALAASFAGIGTAYASTPEQAPSALEVANTALSRQAADEGMVLLENANHALPIAKGNVAVFGVGAYATVYGGTGSGDVNNRANVDVLDGLTNAGYTITTNDAYLTAMEAAIDAARASSAGAMFGPPLDYAAAEQLLTAATAAPTQPTSTALYVVARNAGEGADRSSGKDDYLLGDNELANIKLLGQTYTNVIVILNVGGVVDTSFFAQVNASETDPAGGQALDALLLMSQAGEEDGDALADILSGAVSPSGKLVDTWAAQYAYYPASATFSSNDGNTDTEQYSEGIYVGYRYFDSFFTTINPGDPTGGVNYPFGFGLSYTSFDIATQSVTADGSHVSVTAKVTNTGSVAGKEVVEVYYSAPAGTLDKPYQELAGYGKTDTLSPGQAQLVTIQFNTADMASYDTADAAYVMEAGDYLIRVGDSSRDTAIAAKINLASNVTTIQTSPQNTDGFSGTDLVSNRANFYSYPSQAAELAAAPAISLNPAAITTVNGVSPYSQNVTVDPTSYYYSLDGSLMGSTTAYVPTGQTNWEGTGAAYQPKLGETVVSVPTSSTNTLCDVQSGAITMQDFVAGLSVAQLANIVQGYGFGANTSGGTTLTAVGAAGYTTALYESLGIPGMALSDGPAGLRLTQSYVDSTGTTQYQWATRWPIGTALAQSWNPDLVKQVGTALGKEMLELGVTLWLAPGMNIHRDPLNGRNFEYYSEDPLVAGLNAAAMTAGVQSNPGVGVTLKHFAMNNQENNRNAVNEFVSDRAQREIYLRGFQIAVESAQPMAVMSSYNQINGTYSSANYDLLTDLLRGEWGFQGLVMTDWGGDHNPVASMYAGNDLIEPGPSDILGTTIDNPPALDVDGLPVRMAGGGGPGPGGPGGPGGPSGPSWSLAGLVLSATGAKTVVATIDATVVGQTPQSGTSTFDMATFTSTFTPNPAYTSLQAAYDQVVATIADPVTAGLTAAQAAEVAAGAITVTPTYQVPGDPTSPLVSYTVRLTGNYPTSGEMRLGDLQRSAMRILNIVRQSAPFAQLTPANGGCGVTVGAYTAQFANLPTFLTVTLGNVPTGQPTTPPGGGASAPTGGTVVPLQSSGVWVALVAGLAALAALAVGLRRRVR